MSPDAVSDQTVKWLQVPPGSLKGEGLSAYPEGGTAGLFDWVENADAGSVHLTPHYGQFIVDVVEIEPNAVHQPSKPGDEVVVVLNGALILTTDADGIDQTIKAGEMVLIPAGWAGIYRVTSDDGRFRELCILPGNYFSAAPPPSGESPRRLELPRAIGGHLLHKNTYTLEVENVDRAHDWSITASSDEVIHVLAGELTLAAAGDTATFDAGSFLILPNGFVGKASATAGYRALNARWLG